MILDPLDLAGAWDLLDFQIHYADGRPPTAPFGPKAQGRLLLTPDGHLSATLQTAARAPLGAGQLETAQRASASAKAAAFDSYLSYVGRWRLEGQTLITTVALALTPDIIGQELRRSVTLTPDGLTLSYSLTPKSGVTRHYQLRWIRP